jgi:glycosyltransferase involved in cell wall biosynthesis
MKVLITTPYFSNLGGSELETIHTANAIAEFEGVTCVNIYVDDKIKLDFLKNINFNSKIKILQSNWYSKEKWVKLDKFFFQKFKNKFNLFYSIFCIFILLKGYGKIYIITKSTLNYYLPFINFYPKKKNIVVKFTTIFYENIAIKKKESLIKISENLVTCKKQMDFFVNQLNLTNTKVKEVIIFKEDYALLKIRNSYNRELHDFGIIGRFSEEKQLEHAIILIEDLRKLNIYASLKIMGDGSKSYFEFLQDLVVTKNLENQVYLSFKKINYDLVSEAFDNFNIMLITSSYEGGPNIGLEAMAFGIPILSYDVGAMPDRLKQFANLLIAKNFQELLDKSVNLLSLNESEYVKLCQLIKAEYKMKYCNSIKIEYLKNFIINNSSS